jgi:hypothetical protein
LNSRDRPGCFFFFQSITLSDFPSTSKKYGEAAAFLGERGNFGSLEGACKGLAPPNTFVSNKKWADSGRRKKDDRGTVAVRGEKMGRSAREKTEAMARLQAIGRFL